MIEILKDLGQGGEHVRKGKQLICEKYGAKHEKGNMLHDILSLVLLDLRLRFISEFEFCLSFREHLTL